ncbi:MAG: FecR domain-containing protein [Jhaorihella sp.]
MAQRDRSAEAVLSDVQGAVEGRAPAEARWSGRDLNDILVEFERLRTLSSSTAQVTFRDLSRLRLNANSNATIQRMRSDALTGGEVTKVSLAEGDFYALLNQLSERNTFEIDVPGIETTTRSADFWVKNDASGARFVNYDEPGLEVSRDGRTETLGQGEGLVVSGRGSERAQVLDSPLPMAPEPGAVIHADTAVLGWQAYEGAEAYWLEVASDPGFNHMQVSEWGIRATGFQARGLPPAQYHWRVAALDRLGLPGEWSTPRDFILRQDATPPFLTLLSPAPGTIVAQSRIEVLGASEPDAAVEMNGQALKLGGDGSFLSPMLLKPGENRITLRATDAAGNSSTREGTVIYRHAAAVEIALSPAIPRLNGALAARSDQLSVAAQTDAEPGAAVQVRDATGGLAVQTRVASDGSVQFVVPVEPGERRYVIEVLAPGGAVEGRLEFGAMRDSDAPVVSLDQPPPRATSETVVALAGTAGDAVRLELDGTAVPLRDGRFDLSLTLVPGPNGFDLVASDAVGNVSLARLSTLLDVEPPELLRADLSRPEGAGGPIRLQIEARDESGLRQAAPFVIRVGDGERSGFLRCDAQTGICSATLPPESGTLAIVEIAIEDYAGNVAFQ